MEKFFILDTLKRICKNNVPQTPFLGTTKLLWNKLFEKHIRIHNKMIFHDY